MFTNSTDVLNTSASLLSEFGTLFIDLFAIIPIVLGVGGFYFLWRLLINKLSLGFDLNKISNSNLMKEIEVMNDYVLPVENPDPKDREIFNSLVNEAESRGLDPLFKNGLNPYNHSVSHFDVDGSDFRLMSTQSLFNQLDGMETMESHDFDLYNEDYFQKDLRGIKSELSSRGVMNEKNF